MYRLVIFDLDGTLLNTSTGIIASVKYALAANEKRIPSDDVLKGFIGPPLKRSFVNLPDVEEYEADKLVEDFRKKYRNHDIYLAELYDGILDIVEYLHNLGIKLAIATYKPQDMALRLISHFAIDKYFKVIAGADSEGNKTKADLISEVRDKFSSYNDSEILMIGDCYSDAEAAKLQNISFLGVSYGFEIRATSRDVERTAAIGVARQAQEIKKYIV